MDQTPPTSTKPRSKMNLPNRLTIFRMVLVPLMVVVSSFDAWLPGWNYYVAAIFFIGAQGRQIDQITVTLDSHQRYDVAHPGFWCAADGAAVAS